MTRDLSVLLLSWADYRFAFILHTLFHGSGPDPPDGRSEGLLWSWAVSGHRKLIKVVSWTRAVLDGFP